MLRRVGTLGASFNNCPISGALEDSEFGHYQCSRKVKKKKKESVNPKNLARALSLREREEKEKEKQKQISLLYSSFWRGTLCLTCIYLLLYLFGAKYTGQKKVLWK